MNESGPMKETVESGAQLLAVVEGTEDDRGRLAAVSIDWVDAANLAEVRNEFEFDEAADWRRQIKADLREVEAVFGPIVSTAHKAHKAAVAARNRYAEPLKKAEKILRDKMDSWQAEQRRKALEEQRRLEAAARARAEEERKKAAEALAAQGQAEAAKVVAEKPVEVPAVYVAPPKPEGVVYRETWSAEVEDLGPFLEFVAAHPEWWHLVNVNSSELNKLARSQKERMKIPGVKAISTKTSIVK